MLLRPLCSWLFIALVPQIAVAQYQKSVLALQSDSLLADLRQHGIDTICVYKAYCVGCRGYWIADDTPCRTKGILIPTYIFWKQAGSTYSRKLDNCSLSAAQKVAPAAFWAYAFQHGPAINSEKIKSFVSLDHGMQYSLALYTRQNTIDQYFSGINLVKKLKHPQMRNPYYRHNTHTYTAQLQAMLDSATRIFSQP